MFSGFLQANERTHASKNDATAFYNVTPNVASITLVRSKTQVLPTFKGEEMTQGDAC